MLPSRIEVNPASGYFKRRQKLKQRSSISQKRLLRCSPFLRPRDENGAIKTPERFSEANIEKGPQPQQFSWQVREHSCNLHMPIHPSTLLAKPSSPPPEESTNAAGENAKCSTPSHQQPAGAPPRKLLNDFLYHTSCSGTMETSPLLALGSWGLPDVVVESYAKNGVTTMFEWQAKCLSLPGVLHGSNLVYSAPTSAGKTFVAELLALKCVLESRKKVIFVLPFVSIAQEKCAYLQKICQQAGIKVGGFVANQSPNGGFLATDIAICTIERANSLVNKLLEENRLFSLGLIVVDELHMLGDPHRGYLLELLLTKVLYVCRLAAAHGAASEGQPFSPPTSVQVVGMSAILPNLSTLAEWLHAQFYHTNFRPVPLTEMVKVGSVLYDTQFQKVKELDRVGSVPGDEDDILLLCMETVARGHSVLIFCPTKGWCEKLAQVISKAFLCGNFTDGWPPNTSMGLADICELLKRTQVGLDPILGETIPCGVAFHHAGLTLDERNIVETAFRQSLLKVIVATSTLSSGVNLPARLVIVRTPIFHKSLLDVMLYKQMVGRAGRKGVDCHGESILVCKPNERSQVATMLQSTPRAVKSCLGRRVGDPTGQDDLAAVKRAILEVVASGVACTVASILQYMSSTLLFVELKHGSSDDPSGCTEALMLSAVRFLEDNEFISQRNSKVVPVEIKGGAVGAGDGVKYYATQLGLATLASALSPDEALILFAELSKARKSFVLENELHLVYLVTPICVQEQWPNIDWYRYLCIAERLPVDMKHVADIVGISELFLGRAVQGNIASRTEAQRQTLWTHRRFYTALALHDLVHEVPMVQVAAKYGTSKGLLQSLQGAAGTFAGMATVFCSRLGWKNMELLLSQFQSRLTFGIERELCDLVRLPLLNAYRARALYNAGFHNLASLANANPLSIEVCLREAVPFRTASKEQLRDKKSESKRGGSAKIWCPEFSRWLTYEEVAEQIMVEARMILSKELNVPATLWGRLQDNQANFRNLQGIGSKTEAEERVGLQLNNQQETIVPVHSCPLPAAAATGHVPVDLTSTAHLVSISPHLVTTLAPSASLSPSWTPSSSVLPSSCMPPYLTFAPVVAPIVSTPVPAKTTGLQKGSGTLGTSFLQPFSMDTSLDLSHHALAIIDAACNQEDDSMGDNRSSEPSSKSQGIKNKSACGIGIITAPTTPSHHRSVPFLDADKVLSQEHSSQLESSLLQPTLQDLSALSVSQDSVSGITIIDVSANSLLFDTFLTECKEQTDVSFSVATMPLHHTNGIGGVAIGQDTPPVIGIPIHSTNQQVIGVAFCWGSTDVYYVPLLQDTVPGPSVPFSARVSGIVSILGEVTCRERLVAYHIKEHLKLVVCACGTFPAGNIGDPTVADWLLNPDAKEKTIHKMVQHYIPDQPILAEDGQEDKTLSSIATHSADPQVRAAAESILAFLLMAKLDVLLQAEQLSELFIDIEMPSLLVLAKMELNGIGFSPDQCTLQKGVLQQRLTELEKKAYSLAGRTFSLTSPREVAQVLFLELKLPYNIEQRQKGHPGANGRKRLRQLSTSKDVLQKIASLHPLPNVILVWRRISLTLSNVIFPLLKASVLHQDLGSFRIHATCQTHTATGRMAVSNPTLQSVPKEYDIGAGTELSGCFIPCTDDEVLASESHVLLQTKSSDNDKLCSCISMRNVFMAFHEGGFLAADYSQLELRILAHMSGDEKLKEFLNSNGDVFRMIAGEWLGVQAAEVSSTQRQHAKQICYGMIYGIGAKALGNQLCISEEHAVKFMDSFKNKYPAVQQFFAQTLKDCKEKGYVLTILGRKRFLPHIHSTNIHACSQAERQAINSRIQGSAADLVKQAMINIDKRLSQRFGSSCLFGRCCNQLRCTKSGGYLVLQLHDELLYEVCICSLSEVAKIVQQEMENAMQLSVKFPVTIKTGPSWGDLKDYGM